jgi:CRISPR-associated protein Csm4
VTQAADPIKRDSIYMLRAGSCLPQRISGQFISFTGVAGHPVYRCGKGLYVGLP